MTHNDGLPVARSFPSLATLGLTKSHIDDLAKQGTIQEELSRSKQSAFKLRFRSGGRQVVRSLGGNSQFVDHIRRELAELQGEVKSRRQSRRLIGASLSRLRSAKRRLEPLLPLVGFRFHGREIRRQPKQCDIGGMDIDNISKAFNRSAFMDETIDGPSSDGQLTHKSASARESMREKRRTLFDELRSEALETPNRIRAAFQFEAAHALEIESLLSDRIVNRLRADADDAMPSNETISMIAVKTVVHRQAMQFFQFDRELSEGQPSWDGTKPMMNARLEK